MYFNLHRLLMKDIIDLAAPSEPTTRKELRIQLARLVMYRRSSGVPTFALRIDKGPREQLAQFQLSDPSPYLKIVIIVPVSGQRAESTETNGHAYQGRGTMAPSSSDPRTGCPSCFQILHLGSLRAQ